MNRYLDSLALGNSLTVDEAREACRLILNQEANDKLITQLLLKLHDKKETADELRGFLETIRATASPFPMYSQNLIDVCGTGGDGAQTFNVSTAVALVLASAGAKVAKHGNRGVSSRSGSSDVLQALGIASDGTAEQAVQSLNDHGVSFLFAPAFYPVLAKVAQLRKAIGKATLFNALGPLLNPAPISFQLMGVYDPSLLLTAAEVMKSRGVKRAFVVHGSDRLDELTLTGDTEVIELSDGKFKRFRVSPKDFGLKTASAEDVTGGDPAKNADILLKIFAGEKSARTDLVVMNAAMALVLTGETADYKEAAKRAVQVLQSGATLSLVERLRLKASVTA